MLTGRTIIVILVLLCVVLLLPAAITYIQPQYQPYVPTEYPVESGICRLHDLEGLSQDELICKLGQPTSELNISYDDARDELRCELQNWYPPSWPGNRRVRFVELRWDQQDSTTYAWLHLIDSQWRCLDTCQLDKNVVP